MIIVHKTTLSNMSLKVCSSYSHKMQPVPKRPLENKIFYLDLKMYPGEAALSKNLKFLGAKVEPLFSRSVSVVVTNKESARSVTNLRPFKVPSKPQSWAPLTPITNTTSHSSVFLNESSMDYMDSPTTANSPVTDQNAVSMCRGMEMVKKAILKKQGQGSTDIIERCRQWNVKVYHVEDILSKVDKLKQRFGAQFAAEKKRTQNRERKLNPPFLKVEETKRRGVWYKEFPSSTFDKKIADKVKELYNHFKTTGNVEVSIKSAQGELCKNKSTGAQSLAPTQSVSKSVSKFSESAKPSTAFSLCNVKRKESEPAPVFSRKQRTSHGKKKKLYCEICKMNYVQLDKHLASDTHKTFMSDTMNFLEVQNIILSLPKKEDFLSSRFPFSSDNGKESEGMLPCPTEHLMLIDNMKDYPNAYGHLEDNFTPALFDLQQVDFPDKIDLDTEPYLYVDQHYVSPSCTSQDSAYLPYLEDSYDRIVNGSAEITNASETPLNLSKSGSRNAALKQCTYFKLGRNMFTKTSAVRALDFKISTEDVSTLQCSSVLKKEAENMSTKVVKKIIHSHKRKLGEDYVCSISPLKKRSPLNEDRDDFLNEAKTAKCSQQGTQKQCAQNSGSTDSSFPNALFQEKNNISNDCGICVQATSSPALTLEQEAASGLPQLDKSCALDLSAKSIHHIEYEKSTYDCCEGMPELQRLDNYETCTEPEVVTMPPLSPNIDVKDSEKDAYDVHTPDKCGDLERTILNILSNLDCEDESQNTSQSLIAQSTDANVDAPQHLPNKESYIVRALNVFNDEHNAQDASQFIHAPVFSENQNIVWKSANNETSYDDNAVSFEEFDSMKLPDVLYQVKHEDLSQKIDSVGNVPCDKNSTELNDTQQGAICSVNDCMNGGNIGTFMNPNGLEISCSLNDSKCEILLNPDSLINDENNQKCLIASDNLNDLKNDRFQNGFNNPKNGDALNTSSLANVENNTNGPEKVSFIDGKYNSTQNCRFLASADGNPDIPTTLNDCKNDNILDTKAESLLFESNSSKSASSSNVKEEYFAHLCEETSKSFDCIEMNSSEISCYSLVEEAEIDPSECYLFYEEAVSSACQTR